MPKNPEIFQKLSGHYLSLPHSQNLGLQLDSWQGDEPILSVFPADHLSGRTDSNTVHGGVITTLVDVASATAVCAQFDDYEILATLDLRIDYMHPAESGQPIYCRANCYRLAGQVAFVRSICYQHNSDDPIALGTATFMRSPLTEAQKQQFSEHL